MKPDQLLRTAREVAKPSLRLLCLPYAGGGVTIFRDWARALPQTVEVRALQLPARQDRLGEPGLTRIADIVAAIVRVLQPLSPAPIGIFGHSFGSLVAFELSRSLTAAGTPPRALIVGALRPPHLPRRLPPMFHLAEPAFKDELHRRYGTPRQLLDNAELMQLGLPSLRADLTALETYEYAADRPLDLPLTVLHGRRDSWVSQEDALAWRQLMAPTSPAASGLTLHEVDAGHFFVDTHRAWVMERVADALRAV